MIWLPQFLQIPSVWILEVCLITVSLWFVGIQRWVGCSVRLYWLGIVSLIIDGMENRFLYKVVPVLVCWSLIAAGTVEAVWGLLQVYSYLPSNHSLYALTGSFYNPGPYSGFLSMCLPLALDE